jgi:hypothetical protein
VNSGAEGDVGIGAVEIWSAKDVEVDNGEGRGGEKGLEKERLRECEKVERPSGEDGKVVL